jgi:hypothetical protein
MRLLCAIAVVALLPAAACSSSGSKSSSSPADAGSDVTSPGDGGGGGEAGEAGEAGPPGGDGGVGYDGSIAAAGFPQVPHNQPDAGIFSALRLVTIVPSNYGTAADETELDSWGDYVVTSSWLSTVVAQYGAPTSGTSGHLSGPAITDATYTEALAVAYVDGVLATDGGAAYAPDGHTVYALYLPPTTTVSDPYCAIHYKLGPTGDAVALIQTCTDPGVTTLQSAMLAAGHELVEALTDTPGGAGYTLDADTLQPPALTPWAFFENTNGTPHSELGDLCAKTRWTENGFVFTRIWSNEAAAAGGDPCAPAVPQPYYNVKTTQSWALAAAGQTVTIPLTGWTTGGTTTDWALEVSEVANSTQSTTSTATLTTPTLTSATSATYAGKTYPTLNAGKTASLAVAVPSTAAHGAWAALELRSEHFDATGQALLDPDVFHAWFVGVYVP